MNITLGLAKMKIAALILGPVGIGTLGLLQNLLNAAATASGLNVGVAGAQQIVASDRAAGPAGEVSARRAVLITATFLALGSGLLFWLFREPLAGLVFDDRGRANEVGWLALGVAATAAAGYQTAVLSARRRVGDIARLSIWSAAAGALIGSLSILLWKAEGIVAFILAAPIASLAAGWIFVRRVPPPPGKTLSPELRAQIAKLVGQGSSLTIAVFITLCGQLAIRTLVERSLGGVALGEFQAAWTITTVYLFFIFQAMANDYLPRLTAAMSDRANAQELVNGQAEVGILLAAPILLIMIGMAPLVLAMLYTSEFVNATSLLRFQMLGDLLRLAIWPIAIVLLAGGASRHYTIVEVLGTAVLVISTMVLLPVAGLAAPGLSYLLTNLVYGALIMFAANRLYGIVLGGRVIRMFALLALSCGLVFVLAVKFALAGMACSAILAGLWTWFAFNYLKLATYIVSPGKKADIRG